MHDGHILLGSPWQYHGKVKYDEFKNRCSFIKDGKSVILVPLTSQQVYEDQIKLRGEEERNSKEKQKESPRENGKMANCEKNIVESQKRKKRRDF